MVVDAGTAETAEAVRNEQIRMLYSHIVPVVVANLSLAIIVAIALGRTVASVQVAGWLFLVFLVAAGRMELRRQYRKAAPTGGQLPSWGTRFVVGSACAGLVWGVAVLIFFPRVSEIGGLVLTLTIGGMAAGAAGTLSCFMPAFWAFIIPSIFPLLVRTLGIGDSLHSAMAGMVVVFALFITVVARNTHRAITEAFQLRFENESLLRRLSNTQRSLEETNRDLEKRVQERTADLERQGQALRKAQQLEAVGRLAGGIAHDFNNLLTVILANVSLMLRERHLPERLRQPLEEVAGAAERGAALVRQLLAFGRRQRLAPRVLDVNQVVATLHSILTRLIGERIEIVVVPAASRALVKADRGQLEQVIINLVTNARDAMPEGGTLTISVASVNGHAAEDESLSVAGGSYIMLSVSDTGTGMDAETRRHVFEPFFTTKEQGKGTGLGLATVYGVVDQSGGRVNVESLPGRGSVFRIYLPRIEDSETVAELAPRPNPTTPNDEAGPPVNAGRATILLAEDDEQVRAAMERVLKEAGHQVLVAASGEAALARSRSHAGPIHVLITDVVMTDLGGPELARLLTAERPGVRVLFVSGYNQDEALRGGELGSEGIEYLEKPITFDVLERKLATLLEKQVPRSKSDRKGVEPIAYKPTNEPQVG